MQSSSNGKSGKCPKCLRIFVLPDAKMSYYCVHCAREAFGPTATVTKAMVEAHGFVVVRNNIDDEADNFANRYANFLVKRENERFINHYAISREGAKHGK